MQNIRYIELYEDGILQRKVHIQKSTNRISKAQLTELRKRLMKELENAAKRNPEKTYWMELRTE